jgi:hypothetical protein
MADMDVTDKKRIFNVKPSGSRLINWLLFFENEGMSSGL